MITGSVRLVLFGPPGAGKGTQALYLRDYLDVPHISSGDLFRYHLQQKTRLGIQASEYINQGLLVPDEITIEIILDKLLALQPTNGFLLDGFPRTEYQARILSENLSTKSKNIDKVMYIDVPNAELVRRLSNRYICSDCQAPERSNPSESKACSLCGGELYQRADDNMDSVNTRLDVYQRETVPVLNFYRSQDLVITIDGTGPINCINKRVQSQIDNWLTQ